MMARTTGSNNTNIEQAMQQIGELEAEVAELRRTNAMAQALSQVVQVTAASLDLGSAFTRVCHEMAAVFAVPQVALALFEDSQDLMRVVAEYCAPGYPSGMGEYIPVVGNPITAYVIAHRQPMVVEDAQHDERLGPVRDLMRRRGTVSIMIVPVLIADQVSGTIGIDSPEQRTFSEAEINLARDIAVAISQALANKQLYESITHELEERKRVEHLLQERQATLQEAYERERILSETVRELGCPLIPLRKGVLLVPLIGIIDATRAAQILEQVLEGVSREQAKRVLLDITGVPIIDTHVAATLLRTAHAADLLGARLTLVGVRPEIAQSIIGLGIDLHGIRTQPTLAAALVQLDR